MKKIIDLARTYVGTTENPKNSNMTEFGKWFGFNGKPWCGIFVSFVCSHAGYPLGKIDYMKGFAGCPFALKHFTKAGDVVLTITPQTKVTPQLLKILQPGDIFIVDWEGNNMPDHTGFYLGDIDGQRFRTIEGNTGIPTSTDAKEVARANTNGGAVLERVDRKYSTPKTVWYFIRPKAYGAGGVMATL